MEVSDNQMKLGEILEKKIEIQKTKTQSTMQKKSCERSVLTIIHFILKEIPDSEEKLIDEILNYSDSLWNKAPEVLLTSECWFPLQCILSKYILDFNTEWKIKVLALFNDV